VGAFPTNHVGHTLQVRKDMKERYGVQFPLYDKIEVCFYVTCAAELRVFELCVSVYLCITCVAETIFVRLMHPTTRSGVNQTNQVNGAGRHPLYTALFQYEPELSGYATRVSWNFEKFLLDKNGVPVRRFRPGVVPEEMAADVEMLLKTGRVNPARKKSLNEY